MSRAEDEIFAHAATRNELRREQAMNNKLKAVIASMLQLNGKVINEDNVSKIVKLIKE